MDRVDVLAYCRLTVVQPSSSPSSRFEGGAESRIYISFYTYIYYKHDIFRKELIWLNFLQVADFQEGESIKMKTQKWNTLPKRKFCYLTSQTRGWWETSLHRELFQETEGNQEKLKQDDGNQSRKEKLKIGWWKPVHTGKTQNRMMKTSLDRKLFHKVDGNQSRLEMKQQKATKKMWLYLRLSSRLGGGLLSSSSNFLGPERKNTTFS